MDGEGSKAHSKGGRVRKRTTQKMVAQRRTRKEVGLENALPKGVRAQRRTQKEGVRAQRRTKKKEVGLKNALPKKFDE